RGEPRTSACAPRRPLRRPREQGAGSRGQGARAVRDRRTSGSAMIARDRRALIWGVVAIVTMVVVLRLIPGAFRALTRLRETAVERQATVARAQLLLGERRAVRDSLDHVLRDIVGLVPRLVDGTSQADAQASLSSLVSM